MASSSVDIITSLAAAGSAEESSRDDLREMLLGMKLASLAVTDDKPDSLKRVAKANPWHQEALKVITGSLEDAHRPLTEILDKHFGLTLDVHVDEIGLTKAGHFLDTQGYIAHNDNQIVLAYRCTTSIYDWLTNFSTTTTVWEIEEDYAQGFSGFCDCFDCLCGRTPQHPRVHTGFYNNFLASLSLVKKHVEPLLGPDQPPRTLYICGHSLGAGVATLAACYFLLKYDWEAIPQKLCSVTAGSPRACGKIMRDNMDERIHQFTRSKVRLYRLVRGNDVVAAVPPKALGFRHIAQPVLIDKEGKVTMPLALSNKVAGSGESIADSQSNEINMAPLIQTLRPIEIDDDAREANALSKYDNLVAKIPQSIRDHMPDNYLNPLMRVNGICSKTSSDTAPVIIAAEAPAEVNVKSTRKMLTRMQIRKAAIK